MKSTNKTNGIKSKQVLDVLEGIKLANKRMIDFKKMKQTPVVVIENGKIKHLDPFKLSLS